MWAKISVTVDGMYCSCYCCSRARKDGQLLKVMYSKYGTEAGLHFGSGSKAAELQLRKHEKSKGHLLAVELYSPAPESADDKQVATVPYADPVTGTTHETTHDQVQCCYTCLHDL